MSLSQVYNFCNELFASEKSLRHPKKDWDGFIADLKACLQQEKVIWNHVTKKLSPWIDLEKLESIYNKTGRSRSFKSSARVSPDAASDRRKSTSFQEKKQTSHRRRVTVSGDERPNVDRLKATSFHEGNRTNHRQRVTASVDKYPDAATDRPKTASFYERTRSSHGRRFTMSDDHDDLPSAVRKTTSFHQTSGKYHMRRHTEADANDNEPPVTFRKPTPPRSFQDPPEASMNRSDRKNSFHRMPQKVKSFDDRAQPSTSKKPPSVSKRQTSFHDPFKSSVLIKEELFESLFGVVEEKPEEGKLGELIKEWSHESDGKLRPLQVLLFEAPILFPPNNPLVKHHEYFDKWKVLHRDAFNDEDGNSDGVVRKIARRCKIFLHPDKWPSDLCDDQKLLLQSMWDVFQESELF